MTRRKKKTNIDAELRRRAAICRADARGIKGEVDPNMRAQLEGRAEGLLDAANLIEGIEAGKITNLEMPGARNGASTEIDASFLRDVGMDPARLQADRISQLEARVAGLELIVIKEGDRVRACGPSVVGMTRETVLADADGKPPAPKAPRAKALRPADILPVVQVELDVGDYDLALLAVLRQHDDISRTEAAIRAGYSVSSGAFAKALTRLRRAELIVDGGTRLKLTPKGLRLAPAAVDRLKGKSVLEHWSEKVNAYAGTLLQVIVQAYPDELTREVLAHKTGYSASSGAFAKALRKLRRLELVDGLRASRDLMATVETKR